MPALPEVCVVYLVRENGAAVEVLVGEKKTGLGIGKFVAPGGKLEPGESPRDAAVREVFEEVGIGISADELKLVGELEYLFTDHPQWSQRSWVFVARGAFDNAQESPELRPAWHAIDDLPLDRMWGDAKYWLVEAIRGTPVKATFRFGSDASTVAWSDHPRWKAET